eukprot:scaffold10051_cov90-Isochrysis_galbana.AAC.4
MGPVAAPPDVDRPTGLPEIAPVFAPPEVDRPAAPLPETGRVAAPPEIAPPVAPPEVVPVAGGREAEAAGVPGVAPAVLPRRRPGRWRASACTSTCTSAGAGAPVPPESARPPLRSRAGRPVITGAAAAGARSRASGSMSSSAGAAERVQASLQREPEERKAEGVQGSGGGGVGGSGTREGGVVHLPRDPHGERGQRRAGRPRQPPVPAALGAGLRLRSDWKTGLKHRGDCGGGSGRLALQGAPVDEAAGGRAGPAEAVQPGAGLPDRDSPASRGSSVGRLCRGDDDRGRNDNGQRESHAQPWGAEQPALRLGEPASHHRPVQSGAPERRARQPAQRLERRQRQRRPQSQPRELVPVAERAANRVEQRGLERMHVMQLLCAQAEHHVADAYHRQGPPRIAVGRSLRLLHQPHERAEPAGVGAGG